MSSVRISNASGRLKKVLAASLVTTCLASCPPAKAEDINITQSKMSETIKVTLNQVTLVELNDLIADALIGNPAIADITIQTGKSFIITGKSYGRTNVILLNKKGKTIFNKSIAVDDQQDAIVRLQRGNARVSYTCSPNCQPTPTLGDDREYMKSVTDNIKDKMKGIGEAMSLSANGN